MFILASPRLYVIRFASKRRQLRGEEYKFDCSTAYSTRKRFDVFGNGNRLWCDNISYINGTFWYDQLTYIAKGKNALHISKYSSYIYHIWFEFVYTLWIENLESCSGCHGDANVFVDGSCHWIVNVNHEAIVLLCWIALADVQLAVGHLWQNLIANHKFFSIKLSELLYQFQNFTLN
jgi:hypothetical protein